MKGKDREKEEFRIFMTNILGEENHVTEVWKYYFKNNIKHQYKKTVDMQMKMFSQCPEKSDINTRTRKLYNVFYFSGLS